MEDRRRGTAWVFGSVGEKQGDGRSLFNPEKALHRIKEDNKGDKNLQNQIGDRPYPRSGLSSTKKFHLLENRCSQLPPSFPSFASFAWCRLFGLLIVYGLRR